MGVEFKHFRDVLTNEPRPGWKRLHRALCVADPEYAFCLRLRGTGSLLQSHTPTTLSSALLASSGRKTPQVFRKLIVCPVLIPGEKRSSSYATNSLLDEKEMKYSRGITGTEWVPEGSLGG